MRNSNATAFCVDCGCQSTYTVSIHHRELTIRGTTFSFPEQIAICSGCGGEVYVPALNDQNAQAREDAYRRAAGLISVDEIRNLLQKYDIGAGPLAKVLGLGEVTIHRYLSGQMPSKKNSDLLLALLSSHKLMVHYLEAGKDQITLQAYRKASNALQQLDHLYSGEKIEVVIRYLLHKVSDVTPLSLQKILYYAQAFFYPLYGRELFPDACQAWVHGPVFPDVYHKYKCYGYNPIEAPVLDYEPEADILTPQEMEYLDSIVHAFGCYSGSTLEKMTHNERPWQNARAGLQPEDRSVVEIDRWDVHQYFQSLVDSYSMTTPADIKKYSSAMYEALV